MQRRANVRVQLSAVQQLAVHVVAAALAQQQAAVIRGVVM
jgi:hypothetical protein